MAEKKHNHWVWELNAYDKTWAEVRGSTGFDREVGHAIHRGDPVAEPLPILRITEVTPGLHPDLLLEANYMIASERLAEVIVGSGAHVQLLPVRMKGSRAKYHVVNGLDHVDVLDEAKSKITRFPEGHMRSVKKLVLRPIPPGTPPLFRIATLPLFYVVSDELRRAMEESCEGPGQFVEIDKYKFG